MEKYKKRTFGIFIGFLWLSRGCLNGGVGFKGIDTVVVACLLSPSSLELLAFELIIVRGGAARLWQMII